MTACPSCSSPPSCPRPSARQALLGMCCAARLLRALASPLQACRLLPKAAASATEQRPYISSPCCPACLLQTLAEREAALAAAEQTTRQEAEALEQRKRQTQELLVQAQLHEAQQVRVGWSGRPAGGDMLARVSNLLLSGQLVQPRINLIFGFMSLARRMRPLKTRATWIRTTRRTRWRSMRPGASASCCASHATGAPRGWAACGFAASGILLPSQQCLLAEMPSVMLFIQHVRTYACSSWPNMLDRGRFDVNASLPLVCSQAAAAGGDQGRSRCAGGSSGRRGGRATSAAKEEVEVPAGADGRLKLAGWVHALPQCWSHRMQGWTQLHVYACTLS